MGSPRRRQCLLSPGDLSDPQFCKKVVANCIREFGQLDVLVNNAAEQHEEDEFRDDVANLCMKIDDALPSSPEITASTAMLKQTETLNAAA